MTVIGLLLTLLGYTGVVYGAALVKSSNGQSGSGSALPTISDLLLPSHRATYVDNWKKL